MNTFLIIVLFSLNPRGKISISMGYAEAEHIYTEAGKMDNLPKTTVFNLYLKQSYFNTFKGIEIEGSLEYGFSKWTYFVSEPVTSGFAPQSLTGLFGFKKGIFGIKIGYQYDAGTEPGIFTPKLSNSDNQNAAIFIGMIEKNFNSFTYGGLLEYVLTFPDKKIYYIPPFESEPGEKVVFTRDFGDWVIFHSQFGFKSGAFNYGLNLVYKYITEGIIINEDTGDKEKLENAYYLSFYPFLKFIPSKYPLILTITTSIRDEYYSLGIPLYGKNFFAPFKCITLILDYKFSLNLKGG